jgi:Na+-driven multidrug efflux pump
VAVLAPPLLRRDPTARFWATGMALAAVPVAASVPGERLLLGVGVGAAALIAQLLGTFAERGRAARAGLVTLAAVHVVLAAALLPVRAHSMAVLGSALDAADASLASGRRCWKADR